MKPQTDVTEIVNTNSGKKKTVNVKLSLQHMKMLEKIAAAYRIPGNWTHAVRLMIEDKFEEVNKNHVSEAA